MQKFKGKFMGFGVRGVSRISGAFRICDADLARFSKALAFGVRILAFALVFGFGISSAESKAHADFSAGFKLADSSHAKNQYLTESNHAPESSHAKRQYLAESSATESLDSTESTSATSANHASTSATSTGADTSTAKTPSFWSRLYQPINITKRSYGAFSIGYSQNTITTPKISLAAPNTQDSSAQSRIEQDFSRVARGAFFGLERGWHTHGFMIGGYLNGVAAQDYSLNFGVRFSYLIARYVIPSVGVSYMLQHLKLPNDDAQYNLHGASFNAGLFVNVMRGFGLKLEGMYAYPLAILREGNARLHGNPTFNGYSFVVSFSFYDFSI